MSPDPSPVARSSCPDIESVYTLWQNPRLVPLLHTPDMVLRKLRGGADLMTPGLAGPPFPARATKGSLVAVASLEKPTVPMVVGVCEIDVAALKNARGEKGRAVRGVHWEGDELWAWSVGGRPGAAAPDHIDGWALGESELPAGLEVDLGHLEIDDTDHREEGGVTLAEEDVCKPSMNKRNEHLEGEDAGLFDRVDVEEKPLSTKGKPSCMDCTLLLLNWSSPRNRRSLSKGVPVRRAPPPHLPRY